MELEAKNRELELQSATANVGGSYVELRGSFNVAGTNWFAEGIPPFVLAINGTNVPLARQPESVIRSDVRLTVTETNGAPALVSGTARLRDSFYLSDITALVPGKVASPSRRPPYFSVEKPPLSNWRIDVRVVGDKFLNVRSTLFAGDVTANLRVQGTLEEPIALGDVRIESGLVRFPFANLDVQQGFVTLTSQDPYRPQILMHAGSKTISVRIRMEVSGFAINPSSNSPQTRHSQAIKFCCWLPAWRAPQRRLRTYTSGTGPNARVIPGQGFACQAGIWRLQ